MRPDQAALTRFFSLHYLLPFVIAAVVILHIWALHIPGSGNPTGVDVKDEKDTLPFHPFYTAKDGWFAAAFLLCSRSFVYFAPNYLGHPDNYIPANPLATPAHIVPEWYFWPFYAILRAFTVDFILPAKLWGVLAMFGSILLLFFLPWLDKSPVRSGIYRPVFKRFFWLLVVDMVILGWCGGAPATPFVRRAQPARGGLLFRAFPHHPAAGVGVRDAAAAARLDQPIACCTVKRRKPRRSGISPRRSAQRRSPSKGDSENASFHPGLRRRRLRGRPADLVLQRRLDLSDEPAGADGRGGVPPASEAAARSPATVRSASSTSSSCSAASRSTRKSARPATA